MPFATFEAGKPTGAIEPRPLRTRATARASPSRPQSVLALMKASDLSNAGPPLFSELPRHA